MLVHASFTVNFLIAFGCHSSRMQVLSKFLGYNLPLFLRFCCCSSPQTWPTLSRRKTLADWIFCCYHACDLACCPNSIHLHSCFSWCWFDTYSIVKSEQTGCYSLRWIESLRSDCLSPSSLLLWCSVWCRHSWPLVLPRFGLPSPSWAMLAAYSANYCSYKSFTAWFCHNWRIHPIWAPLTLFGCLPLVSQHSRRLRKCPDLKHFVGRFRLCSFLGGHWNWPSHLNYPASFRGFEDSPIHYHHLHHFRFSNWEELSWPLLLPIFLLTNCILSTFYFGLI